MYLIVPLLLLFFAWIWQRQSHRHAHVRYSSAWFKAKYSPNVPHYISRDNVHDIIPAHIPLQQQAAIKVVLDKLAGNAQNLPKTSAPFTCAVVGNSGNLLGSGYGPDIDAHTYVLRMNNAPIRGFEQDVGTRTTHHITHTNRPLIRPYDGAVTVLIVDDQDTNATLPSGCEEYRARVTTDLQWLTTQMFPGKFPAVTLPFNPKDADNYFPTNLFDLNGAVHVLHPAFLEYINEHWFLPASRGPSDYPSTGFKAIILALHLCDSVTIYGFGANIQKNAWHHYFDAGEPLTGAPATHRADYQELFLEELERQDIVSIRRGDAS